MLLKDLWGMIDFMWLLLGGLESDKNTAWVQLPALARKFLPHFFKFP